MGSNTKNKSILAMLLVLLLAFSLLTAGCIGSKDTDGDGIPDKDDPDDDNDGVVDEKDAFPLDPKESGDIDGDGIGDNADTDTTSVTVKINYGNGVVDSYPVSTTDEDNSVYDFLILASEKGEFEVGATDYGEWGMFVEEINGVGNGADVEWLDDTDQRWWQYYVNDTLGDVGASFKTVSDGDVIEWRFEIPPF